METRARADALIRATLALGDAPLRVAYLRSLIRDRATLAVAEVLENVCMRAELAEPRPREVLLALVDALQTDDPAVQAGVRRLRDEAAHASHLALERLLRQPSPTSTQLAAAAAPRPDVRLPDFGRGRPLTLGERKWLARRPDRDVMARLLADPHPEVIRRLLANPRLTEDDVVRLATKRPSRADVLAEIARTDWVHRARVRLSLVLNPSTPVDVAAPVVSLLLRQELRQVVESPQVAASVRALCLEHLERRPPADFDEGEGGTLQ